MDAYVTVEYCLTLGGQTRYYSDLYSYAGYNTSPSIGAVVVPVDILTALQIGWIYKEEAQDVLVHCFPDKEKLIRLLTGVLPEIQCAE